MRIFYNETTGEWYREGDVITRPVENGVFSGIPSVEQLISWGFVERGEPVPTPEERVAQAKRQKIAELEAYDSSDAVNSFDIVYNGATITDWLTPDKRANYKNSLDSAEILGMDVVHPVFGGIQFELSVPMAKTSLAKVQIYADQCYIATESHRAAINTLETVEAVQEYDFTTGYPEKLVFNLEELT